MIDLELVNIIDIQRPKTTDLKKAFNNAFCYLIFSFLFPLQFFAQVEETKVLIEQLDSCFGLIYQGNISEAEALMISTQKQCEAYEDPTFRFQADIAYLNLFMMTNKFDLAIERGIGIIEKCKEDFGENSFEYSTVHNSMGILYQHDYQYGKALDHFNIALSIIREVFGEESFYSAGCLNNLGLIYSNIEQYEKSMVAFKESSSIYEKLINDPKEKNRAELNLAECYANLSVVLIKIGKIDQAKIYIANGLKVIESSNGTAGPKYAKLLMDMGAAFNSTGDPQRANEYLSEANDLYDRMFSDFHEVKLSVKLQLFDNFIELEKFGECSKLISSLEELLAEIPNDHIQHANYFHLMAKFDKKQGRYSEAEKHFNLAIASHLQSEFSPPLSVEFLLCEQAELCILSNNFSRANDLLLSVSEKLNDITEIGVQRILLESEFEMVSARLSFNQKTDDYLHEALQHIRKVDSLKVFFDDFYQSDENIINHNKRYQDIYNLGIHICHDLYLATKKENYVLQALSFMERSRASALMENLTERQRLIDNSNFQELFSIKSHIQKIEDEIQTCDSLEEIIHLQNKSSKLWNDYFELRHRLNDESAFLYAPLSATSTQLARSIDDKLLLEFHCSDSIIYLVAASNEKLKIRSVRKNSSLENSLSSWLGKVTEPGSNTSEIKKESQELSTKLFGGLLNEFPNEEIIVIPHETLSLVPFEVLSDGSHEEFEFLIENRSVSYSYSISLLDFSLREKHIDRTNNYIALTPDYKEFAPDEYSQRYHNVKFSVESVSSTIKGLDGKRFNDHEANISNLSQHGNGSKIIHIVAHGYLNKSNHLESGFILCGDTPNKARLVSSKDVYQLNLENDLTILNSCDAENGTLFDQEGLMSLSRAFLFAGSRSLATTKWSAPDESSAMITEMFLKNLKKGMNKSIALQKAKNEYLEDETIPTRLKHPFFWSSIVVVGNYQPIDIQNNDFLLNTCLALLTIVLAGFLFVKVKKSRKLLSRIELSK